MGFPAIDVQSLGKQYVLGAVDPRMQTFGETLSRALSAPFRKFSHLNGRGQSQERIWALKDVSFKVMPGEVVGVIGRNGAGKSTLLKVLSRITEPSEGRIVTLGRVASLMEIGTGFHPELTGRENIFLNGAILGMKRSEIRRKFDEIVAFAEVEKFMDTPVKRYSSGMYVRLAFAVAAYLEPEILVVDEVLAVGDVQFQRKCLGKMGNIANEGRTVVFVSHNMGAIRNLCGRCIVLREGRLLADAPAEDAIRLYMDLPTGESSPAVWVWAADDAPGCDDVRLKSVIVSRADTPPQREVRPDEGFDVVVEYDQYTRLCGARVVLQLVRATGEIAFSSTDQPYRGDGILEPGRYRTACSIPGRLLNIGSYQIKLWMDIYCQRYLIEPTEIGVLTVAGPGNHGGWQGAENWPGAVCPKLNWGFLRIDAEPVALRGSVSSEADEKAFGSLKP